MQTTQRTPSKSQQASAMRYLSNRHLWRWARNKDTGRPFIAIPSSDGEHVHQVHPQGDACSCPAYQQWGYALCSHALAVREANSEDALAAMLAEIAPRASYAEALPTCRGCGTVTEDGTLCLDCLSEQTRRETLAAKRERLANR